MSFGNPWALSLLALVPLFLWMTRHRLPHLSPLRRWLAIGLRLVLLALLVLALADARRTRSSDALSVVYLVDASDSVPPQTRQAMLNFVRESLAGKPADDTAGLVVFGANALVEDLPRPNLQVASLASTPDSGYTNFAEAIRLGLTLFPAGTPKRLVLLSDGRNNLGDARSAARLAAGNGVSLSTVEFPAATGPEVRLQGLVAPNTLHQDENFNLELAIDSNQTAETEVQIFADGRLIAQEGVTVKPGENRFLFPLVAGAPGFSTFQARLAPAADTQLQNNRLDAFSLVSGPLRVLVVASDPAEAANLMPALDAAGLRPELVTPPEMPTTPLALSEYSAVVVLNTPAFDFRPAQLDLLQTYVRDLGGGLVVGGGPESFGAGGYFQTPLEETLPVEMALKDRQRLPGMTMLMVIDKSGSMEIAGTANQGGPRKIELAKEAIYRAIDLLAPWDRVGVVSFDNAARWVVRPVPVVDVESIKNQVGTLRADGGTDILAGLKAAAAVIVREESRVKHIVLLTDGGANPQGIPEQVDDLVAHDVSVSVVAIGDDYAPFLEGVAERGNGRFHFARDASTIPQIFAQEATLALKAYLIEEEFTPERAAPSPILQGIEAAPPLLGYVATTPKLTAQTVLVSHQDDPVLAQWQYGLGRAVAWTSDAGGRWARNWVGWADYPRFWGQAVRWTIVEGAGGHLETQISFNYETGTTRLTVEALDERGNFLNDLTLTGSVVAPDLTAQTVTLSQIAPGRYQTDLHAAETGAWLLRLLATGPDGQLAGSATRGFVVSYSPEYATENRDPDLMANLAELGGGAQLSADRPGEVFVHDLPPVQGATPLWPTLLTVFVLLLPLDVALRRVIVGREDVQRVLNRLRAVLPAAAPESDSAPAPESSAGALLSIKTGQTGHPPSAPRPADDTRPVVITRPPNAPPSPPPAPGEPPSPGDDDRMSRLLKAKRKAKK